ncbi:hypothetical protein ACO0K9_11785 [Undibacterium sp. Ji50W]|uniref:hypothetical protein n=1 Tax=Undibacterium sp. Ji50W TaxID=3413041 RepID=UPI003BF42350
MKTQLPAPAEAQTAQQAIKAELQGTQPAQLSTETRTAFADNRPAAVAQRQLQTLMHNSPQAAQASTLQAMMRSSPGAQRMQAVQRMADDAALHVLQQKQGRVRPTFQMKAGVPVNDDAGLASEADVMGGRALNLGTAQLARDGQAAHSSEGIGARVPIQGKLMPQAGGSKVVQAVTDGTKVSLPLLGDVAESETKLKQWDGGEFYAWNLNVESKDERHAHAFDLKLADAKVSLKGHVVTAKGVQGDDAAEAAKRNQTSHKFVGEKGAGNVWAVPAPEVDVVRKELPQGRNANGAVLKADHDAYAKNIRDDLHASFSKMLNMPDDAVAPGKERAAKRQAELDKERDDQLKAAAALRDAEPAADIDLGNAFDEPAPAD